MDADIKEKGNNAMQQVLDLQDGQALDKNQIQFFQQYCNNYRNDIFGQGDFLFIKLN